MSDSSARDASRLYVDSLGRNPRGREVRDERRSEDPDAVATGLDGDFEVGRGVANGRPPRAAIGSGEDRSASVDVSEARSRAHGDVSAFGLGEASTSASESDAAFELGEP